MWAVSFAIALAFVQQDGEITFSAAANGGQVVCVDSDAAKECHGMPDVEAVYQDMRVQADWTKFDYRTKILTAGDKVHFTRGAEHIDGGYLEMNIDTKAGSLKKAVKGQLDPGFWITADEVHRIPDQLDAFKYRLRDGTFATCGECPSFEFRATHTTVYPGKRLVSRNTVLRFGKVPVFYLPWISVPAQEHDRATGFLIPSTSFSKERGRGFRESFFYVINRSADVTITGEHFSLRGLSTRVDFRSRPNADTWIEVDSLFVNDKLNQGGRRARVSVISDLAGFRTVGNVEVFSSLLFRQIWDDRLNVISSPIQRATVFGTKNTAHRSYNLLFDRETVYRPSPGTSIAECESAFCTTLRKFPALEVESPSNRLGNLPAYLSWEGSVAGAARKDPLIPGSQSLGRLNFHPSIEIPLKSSSVFEWGMRVGARDLAYTHSFDANQGAGGGALNRLLFDYTMRLAGPQLERRIGRLRHVVESSVEYRWVGGNDDFRRTIIFDGADLVASTNEVEYAITNRLMRTRKAGAPEDLSGFVQVPLISWRIAQKFFFEPEFGGAFLPNRRNAFTPLLDLTGFAYGDERRRVSPIVSTVRLSAFKGANADFEVDYDTARSELRTAGVGGSYNHGKVGTGVSYTFTRPSALLAASNQIMTSIAYGPIKGLTGSYSFSYNVAARQYQGAGINVSYNHKDCYWLTFAFTGFNIGFRKENFLQFALTLKGIGSIGTIPTANSIF